MGKILPEPGQIWKHNSHDVLVVIDDVVDGFDIGVQRVVYNYCDSNMGSSMTISFFLGDYDLVEIPAERIERIERIFKKMRKIF